MAFSADAAALVGAGTALSLWPLSLAVSTTDQAWLGFAEASVWVVIMDRLPSSKELETFKDLKKDGMTETTSEWVGGGSNES